MGIGSAWILQNRQLFLHPIITYSAVIAIFGFSFLFSYYRVKDFYNYSPDLVQIANIIKTLTKEDDKIVTDTTGDTTLLYLTERRGAPSVFKEFKDLKNDGYVYFVTYNKHVIDQMKTEGYTVIFENDKFGLIKL